MLSMEYVKISIQERGVWMKCRFIVVLILVAFAAVTRADMQWQKLAEDAGLPNMVGHAVAAHDGKIYVGGRYWNSAETYVYNGSQWATAAALPEGRRNTQFIEYDGELLCVGGTTPSANVAGTVWKLTESGWVDHSSGYYAVTTPGLAVFNGDLYSVGGYRNTPQALVQRYDSTTGWQTLTNAVLPVGHESWQGITTFNNRIYVTGLGASSATGPKVYYYDGTGSAGAQWHAAPDLPEDMTSLHSTLVWNDRMYALGGSNVFSMGIDDTAWRTEPNLPVSIYRAGAAVFDEKIYVIGGSPTGSSGSETNDVYVLIPEPSTALLLIPALGALLGWWKRFR
jgi:N-acetylneuraminic acid mutarotase